MKLETSQLLTRLSEQERDKVEAELAELNGRKHKLEQQLLACHDQIKLLTSQRDQATDSRNAASLLQEFDAAFREQQNTMDQLKAGIAAMEEEKQGILNRLSDAQRTHYAYDNLHEKEKHKQTRREDQKSQRQMDDMIASKRSASSV